MRGSVSGQARPLPSGFASDKRYGSSGPWMRTRPWIQHAVRSTRVDLRTVAGEVSPAGLFATHSLTRERLMGLAELFELEFRWGKSRLSTEDPGDCRHADYPCGGGARGGGQHDAPIMPRRLHGAVELDQKYPPIQAV